MSTMYKPFKSAALGYVKIHDYVRDNTTVENPISIEKLYDILKDDVKNIQQVRDAIKRFREMSKFSAIREGRQLAVWWRGSSEATVNKPDNIVKQAIEVKKSDLLALPQAQPSKLSDMPEVQITKHAINILAGGVKITIERY